MPSQTPDTELGGTIRTLVPRLCFAALLASLAFGRFKEAVRNPTGGELFLVRRLCLVTLATAVRLRPRLWLPGNFGSKRRTKKTLPIVFQQSPPLVGELLEAGYTPGCQDRVPRDIVMQT